MATFLGTGWLRTFASLSVRDYRGLWLGTAASFMSMQMQEAALALFMGGMMALRPQLRRI